MRAPAGTQCSHTYIYEWDELNRLITARRYDYTDLDADAPPAPNPTNLKAELQYKYDAEGQRTLKTAIDANGTQKHTLYIFDSLELRRAGYDPSFGGGTPEYELSNTTEVAYLIANGVRLARAVYAPTVDAGIGTNDPYGLGRNLRIFLELSDHLGSTTIVVDQATGELVERGTYQAYGATESDHRPDRWEAFREDYRFTGKEEDVEVGLTYFGKRFYAPLLGRWVSPHPLAIHEPTDAEVADLNLYSYVKGQALVAVDVLGLFPNEGSRHDSIQVESRVRAEARRERKGVRPGWNDNRRDCRANAEGIRGDHRTSDFDGTYG